MPAVRTAVLDRQTEWQVQCWNSQVEEWFGFAFCDYDRGCKRDAQRAERVAQQYGWSTRLVQVVGEDE